MWRKFLKDNIAGVLIGVIGLASALVTLLIGTDLSSININVRWFIAFVVVFLSIIAIMFKVIIKYEDVIRNWEDIKNEYKIKTFSTTHQSYILVSSHKIPINSMMTIFYDDDGIEVPAGLCKYTNCNLNTYTINIRYFDGFLQRYGDTVADIEGGNKNKVSKLKAKNFILTE